MKIETNKRDLDAVLDLVGVAKGSGKADNIITHVCFQTREGQVEVLTSNTRLRARGVLVANVEGEGAFTVEFWRLTKWLGSVGDAPVTLALKGSSVAVSCANSRIVLQSLDPAHFPPVPDFTIPEDAPEMEAKRAHGLLSYLRTFVLEKETIHPQYNVAEARNGAFWSCNQKALVIMTIPELATTQLRIHKLEFPGLLAFIAACGTRSIKFVERTNGEDGFHVVHPGGTSLFVPRPRKEFPDLTKDLHPLEGEAACVWEISPEHLITAVEGLTASADSENYYVRLSTAGTDLLDISIRAVFGSEDSTAQVPAKIRSTKQFAQLPVAKMGFHHPSLLAAMGKIKDEVAALQIFAPEDAKKGRPGGLSRLVSKTKEGDEIHTILHWVAQ